MDKGSDKTPKGTSMKRPPCPKCGNGFITKMREANQREEVVKCLLCGWRYIPPGIPIDDFDECIEFLGVVFGHVKWEMYGEIESSINAEVQ